MTYPITALSSRTDTLNICQISDLHLTGKIGHAPSYQRFLAVLKLTTFHHPKPDLLLLTGDLVNDGNRDAYDWLFDTLDRTDIPYLAIAGNHDVTHEIGTSLPYPQRLHIPINPDARLLDRHAVMLNFADTAWQLLLINSAVNGETHGALPKPTLDWLDQQLTQNPAPTIIAMHHHPLPVRSAWIDAYVLDNQDDFWQIIKKHPHAHTVLCGHVHQVHTIHPLADHPVQLLTCLSTDRQFAPFCDEFRLDDAPAGCRMIHISNNHTLSSYIIFMQNTPPFAE